MFRNLFAEFYPKKVGAELLAYLSGVLSEGLVRGKNSRLIFVPIAVIGLAAISLAVLATIWAGEESDLAALERQKELVTTKLAGQVNQIAADVARVASGYASLLPGKGDIGADGPEIRRFGETTAAVFGFEQMLLVNGRGDLLYEGEAAIAQRYQWIRPLLADLFAKVRHAHSETGTGGVDAGSSISARAEIQRLEGRAAIVGISPVLLLDGRYTAGVAIAPQTRYYLIAFRFVDGTILDELSREMGLKGARYARTVDAEAGEVAFQVEASATRDPIGVIIWTPDLPGSRVIERLAPYLAAAIVVIGSLFSLLVLRLNRSWKELRRNEQHAREVALQDVLTRLPNRGFFARRLDECFASASLNTSITVGLIDLDRFKAVNDSFGHAVGDELIIEAAHRMGEVLAGRGTLARLGGDEFALILLSGQDEHADIGIFDQFISALHQPFALNQGS